MRISDWSSDVCSSDLSLATGSGATLLRPAGGRGSAACGWWCVREAKGNPADENDHGRSLREGPADARHRARVRHHRLRLHADLRPLPQGGHHLLGRRSEEHTSELQSLMRISYAVFCLKKKNKQITYTNKTL